MLLFHKKGDEHMKKWIKIGFPIVCVVVVGGTLIIVGNLTKKANEISNQRIQEYYNTVSNSQSNSNTNNYYSKTNYIESDYNTTNTYNTNISNSVTNTNRNANTNTNTNTNTSTNQSKNTKSEESDSDLAKVDDKAKAIALVKEEWGEDSSVYFTNEGFVSGYYSVAVRDKSNTSVKMFYKVDVNKKTVEVDW